MHDSWQQTQDVIHFSGDGIIPGVGFNRAGERDHGLRVWHGGEGQWEDDVGYLSSALV